MYVLGTGIKKSVTIEKRAVNRVYWSPNGRFILLAGIKFNGVLEFYDVDDEISLTNNIQHSNCTDVEWDPTGRYVVTFVSHNKGVRNENGYKMWTFYGAELREERKNVFYQFSWRPRPSSILPKETLEWLKRKENFKQFRDKFNREDRNRRESEYRERAAVREELRKKYTDYMKQRLDENEALGFFNETEDEDLYEIEEDITEVLEVTEEVIE